MGLLQQLGRSLMLPMIALPAAAVLLFFARFPWHLLGWDAAGAVFTLAGQSVFDLLPFIFAAGVALGLTENNGIAGMTALVSYFMFDRITAHHLGDSFHPGVAGGVLIGILSGLSYQRLKQIRLPEPIQFFGGPRIVPLVMSAVTLCVAYLAVMFGPWFMAGLERFSAVLEQLGGFGAFLYGVLYRMLVPSGLHHILNNVFWFQVGSYERADGQIVYGDLPRFFAGDPTAGVYMAGLYPIMMFALPAIALAIIQEAREDLKPKIRATFLTAALTSFLTGVTEPIEFAFLFVAPYLFIVHAVLSGTAMWLACALGIRHGFSFSAGAIDFLINAHLSERGLLLIPIGLGYGLLYYVLFRWAIRRFRIPTPGREEGSHLEEWAGDIPYRSPLILQALGGKNNIKNIEACITRLRLTLENDRLIDIQALKHLGAAGVIRLGGGNVQVVFGTYSELIREEIMKVIRKDAPQVLFCSPVQGKMIPLEEVPDEIFARKIVGNGVAFIPERGELVAPLAGKVTHIYPTMHAVGLVSEEGLEVLLHIGIDTVKLQGKGFTAAVKVGDVVSPGQLLIRFDLQNVKKHCKSLATPLVVTNPQRVRSWSFAPYKAVKKGQKAVMSVVLKEESSSGGLTNG
jgi:PTS system D-glucosamine-specific IIC component